MLLTKAEAAKPLLQLKTSVEVQPHLNRVNFFLNPTVLAFVRYLESSFFKFVIVLRSFKNSSEATTSTSSAMGCN